MRIRIDGHFRYLITSFRASCIETGNGVVDHYLCDSMGDVRTYVNMLLDRHAEVAVYDLYTGESLNLY